MNSWMTDGMVDEVLTAPTVSDGVSVAAGAVVPAGALRVTSRAGTKWIMPDLIARQVRKAPSRPGFVTSEKVDIWSNSMNSWLDGVVVEVLTSPSVSDGRSLPLGTVLPIGTISVSSRAGTKWVLPEVASSLIRRHAVPVAGALGAETVSDGIKAFQTNPVAPAPVANVPRAAAQHQWQPHGQLLMPRTTAATPVAVQVSPHDDELGPTVMELPKRAAMPRMTGSVEDLGPTRHALPPKRLISVPGFKTGLGTAISEHTKRVGDGRHIGGVHNKLQQQQTVSASSACLISDATRAIQGPSPSNFQSGGSSASPSQWVSSGSSAPYMPHPTRIASMGSSGALSPRNAAHAPPLSVGCHSPHLTSMWGTLQPSSQPDSLEVSQRLACANELQRRLSGASGAPSGGSYDFGSSAPWAGPATSQVYSASPSGSSAFVSSNADSFHPPRASPSASASVSRSDTFPAQVSSSHPVSSSPYASSSVYASHDFGGTQSQQHVLRVLIGDGRWEELTFFSGGQPLQPAAEGFLQRHGVKTSFLPGLVEMMQAMISRRQMCESVDIIELL